MPMLTDPTMRSEPEINPTTPDPTTAQARLDAFVAANTDALFDGNHPNHRVAVKERSRMFQQVHGDGLAADPTDASSSGFVEPGDHHAAIERVIERHYGGWSEEAAAFTAGLVGAGIGAADVAGIAEQVAGSSPMSDAELVGKVSRDDLRAAAAFLEDHPEVDDLIAPYDLHRFPAVLRELARRHREAR